MAAHTGRMAELAASISENTKKIESYFIQNGLPQPSFDPNAPADFPVSSDNKEIQAARKEVIRATRELHDLMMGPRESIRWGSWDFIDNLTLHAIYQFNVAKIVPIDGEISYGDIARATNVDEVNLRRLIRHAMTKRIFKEPREGYVAHTAASRILCDDAQMIDWVGLLNAEFFKAAAWTVDAMVKYPGSQEPSEAAYPLAHNTDVAMFIEMGKNPERAKRFSSAMSSLSNGDGYTVESLVNGYAWAGLGKATIVDVGGSHGFVCVALGETFPDLQFVVQDLPKYVADGPSKIPPGLSSRIQFQAHDFFTEQPIKHADVYFFRWIFHNWSDKYSIKILKALIPALNPGARIIINDVCLRKPGSVNAFDERITRTMDTLMLVLLNAKERDEGEWKALFKAADPRYRFLGARDLEGSRMSIIEAIWEPVSAIHNRRLINPGAKL